MTQAAIAGTLVLAASAGAWLSFRTRLSKRPILGVLWALSLWPPLFWLASLVLVLPETHVRLERPWLSPLFPAALGFVVVRHLAQTSMSRARAWLLDVCTGTAVLALCAVVVGVEIGRSLDRLTVIFVVDRSRSIDMVPDAGSIIDRELTVARAGMREGDRSALVVFGATAATEQPVHEKGAEVTGQRAVIARDGSDLDKAIRRAVAEVPPDSAARIVLISDGVATRGDTLGGAFVALAARVPVDVLPLMQAPPSGLRVVSVRTAARAKAGEAVELAVALESEQASEVELRVKRDGQLIRRVRVHKAAGLDVVVVRDKAASAGLSRYDVEASLIDGDDDPADDNASSAFLRVSGKSTALLLEGDPGQGAFVRSALEQAEMSVDERGALAVPADVGGFAAFDLVVLSDIAAQSLDPTQIEALAAYVRDLGGGLLLLGGDRSFGPGGYAKTPIEEVSPVSFELKQDERRASVAQVMGIDISGSMSAMVGGQTKLELANEGAVRAAQLLGKRDRLGVAHVDTTVHWSVPLAGIDDLSRVERAIRAVGAGGGGIMVPITLQEGYGALRAEVTNIRHLLLFADGDDADDVALAMPLTAAAHAEGITTSVVALGGGKDLAALSRMAELGGGRFYAIEDASRLPAVFAQETVLATRSALVEEPFRAKVVGGRELSGIDFDEAPELGGYVVTLPKPRAAVSLTGPDDDPVLATWSVGLGRSAAFTSDLKARWGGDWTLWQGSARLVGQLGRELARRGDDERVRLLASTVGGRLSIRAHAQRRDGHGTSLRTLRARIAGPGGFARELPLDPSGVGSYALDLAIDRPGTYVATVVDEADGRLLGTTAALLGAGEELRPTGSDLGALGKVAQLTNGFVRSSLAGVFADRVEPRFAYEPARLPLLGLAALAALLAAASRKLVLPARARKLRKPATPPPVSVVATGSAEALLTAKRAHPLPRRVAEPSAMPTAPKPAAQQPAADPAPAPPSPPAAKKSSSAEILAAKRRARK